MTLEQVLLRDTRANQPAATTVAKGSLYYVTDESVTEQSDGTTWLTYSDSGTGGITQLTGDVTAGPGTGSQAATVANAAITFAKIQNIGTDKLIGRDTAGSGVSAEIGVASGIEFNGSNSIRVTPNVRYRTIKFIFDGGASTPATGTGLPVTVDYDGVIVEARIFGQSAGGSAVVDIWKDTYANYPPTIADSIVAAAPPTLAAANKNKDTTLTGWNTTVTAGDVFMANLNSVTTSTWITVELKVLVS